MITYCEDDRLPPSRHLHQVVAARIASGELRRCISFSLAPRYCERETTRRKWDGGAPPGCPAHPTRKWRRGTGQQVRFADLTALGKTLCVLGRTGLMRAAVGSNTTAPANPSTVRRGRKRERPAEWAGRGEDFTCPPPPPQVVNTRQRGRRRWKASLYAPRWDRGCPMEEAILSSGAGMSADAPKQGTVGNGRSARRASVT